MEEGPVPSLLVADTVTPMRESGSEHDAVA